MAGKQVETRAGKVANLAWLLSEDKIGHGLELLDHGGT